MHLPSDGPAYCVFLAFLISQVVGELMSALWSLMKPNTALGFKALTVLGKLGGRNRRFLLNQPPRLEYRDNPEHGFR